MIPHREGGLQEGLGGGFPVIWSGMAAMEGENFAGSGGERAKKWRCETGKGNSGCNKGR